LYFINGLTTCYDFVIELWVCDAEPIVNCASNISEDASLSDSDVDRYIIIRILLDCVKYTRLVSARQTEDLFQHARLFSGRMPTEGMRCPEEMFLTAYVACLLCAQLRINLSNVVLAASNL
jgi:hypothetical protein